MGWIGPAIMAAEAVGGWIKNKHDESAAKKKAQQQQDDYYNSPMMQAVNAYLRDYWTSHNLQSRAPGLNIDDLLKPRPLNMNKYNNPGAGGQLGTGLLNALAAYYGGKKGSSSSSSSFWNSPGWEG